MANAFKLLIFDWDGTLVDSEARILYCVQEAARGLNLPLPTAAAMRHVIGVSAPEAVRILFPLADSDDHHAVLTEYRRLMIDQHTTSPVALFPGVAATLRELHAAGYWLAIATGKNRQGLELELAATGLNELMVATRCADESLSKPNPAMVLELLDACGVEPQEALVIGDTTYDIQMAHNARVAAVAVSYGVHAKDLLLSHSPKLCIDTISALRVWLNTTI